MKIITWRKGLGLASMSLLLLSACGQNNGGTTGGDAVSTNNPNSTQNNKEVLNVSVDGERYVEFVNQIKPKFEEEYGIMVEINNTPMFDQLEALPLDGPAGLGTDIMMAPYDRAGVLGQQGHLLEVNLPDDMRYDEKSLSMVKLNDKIYSAPFIVETLVMFYNKDLLSTPPKTFEELEELSKDERFAFPGEDNTNIGFLANWIDFNQAYGLIAGYGGYVFGDEGQNPEDIGINTPGAIEGIEYISEWYKDVWPQGMKDASSAGSFKNQSFMDGKNAANIAGTWMTGDFKASGVNFGVTTIPTLPNGEPYQPFAGGKGWIISTYTEIPELAQEWVDYVTNEKNSQLFYETTTELPVNKQTRESIIAEGTDELAMATYNQFDTATNIPIIPQMAEVWEAAKNMLFDAVSGNKSAEESANDTVEIIKTNIEQKY